METLIKVVGIFTIGFVIGIAISFLLAFPVKWTWNYTMPYLFNFREINVLHAWCLVFLAGCIRGHKIETKK